jgi:hypothetical protein
MTASKLWDKVSAAKARGDYEEALLALTEFMKKALKSEGARWRPNKELGRAHMERAECSEHLNRPIEAFKDYMEATVHAPLAGIDNARKTIYLRLSQLCRGMGDELWAVMFGVQAILAEAVLRIHQKRNKELVQLRTQVAKRVRALLVPAVDAARRKALLKLVHEYLDSDDVTEDEEVVAFELPEAVMEALGHNPDDAYGGPIAGRRF